MAMIDIDEGGREAAAAALQKAADLGLWAFAQLGESDSHSGGHVYIPLPPVPTSFAHNIAARVQAACQVSGEAYPCSADLRLPLMPHLRAPAGPQCFPLLTQQGKLIEVSTPAWDALAWLYENFQDNDLATATAALESLPPLSIKNPTPLHKSKVNPLSGESIIRWFCDSFSLAVVLARVGADLGEKKSGAVRCPFHDDHSPSLVFWQHESGRTVCRCFSQHSNCPAAVTGYWDAFNVYCELENLRPGAAVRGLCEEYNLGKRRELKIESIDQTAPLMPLELHQRLISQKRDELRGVLTTGATRRGLVTIARATPGLGKTHAAAELALTRHAAGDTVVIVAPQTSIARNEWLPRLGDVGMVWQSRLTTCTCFSTQLLNGLAQLGYSLPKCLPGCPYGRQVAQARGKIVIFQHAHLHIDGGRAIDQLAPSLVIVDESPLAALLEERTASNEDVRLLLNRISPNALREEADPADRLLSALWKVAHASPRAALRGKALLDALEQATGGLQEAIEQAKQSKHAARRMVVGEKDLQLLIDAKRDVSELAPVFFGELLDALTHDAARPDGNGRLAWGKVGQSFCWTWYERHTLLADSQERGLISPAVIVLDGSADELISSQVFKPWPVELHRIDAPPSPVVEIVQCPVTRHTRQLTREAKQVDYLARQIGIVCESLGVTVDAGVSYLGAVDALGVQLGGQWLHYGGQRGNNDLAGAKCLAIVASPTVPPDAIQRKALALWTDDTTPIDCTAEKRANQWHYSDERMEAMNALHGPEELRQAAHRCRPILSEEPSTLLIFSPWSLEALGLAPTRIVDELPYGNSSAAREQWAAYQARLQQNDDLQSGIKNKDAARSITYTTLENTILLQDEAIPPPASPLQDGARGDGWELVAPTAEQQARSLAESAVIHALRGSIAWAESTARSVRDEKLRTWALQQVESIAATHANTRQVAAD